MSESNFYEYSVFRYSELMYARDVINGSRDRRTVIRTDGTDDSRPAPITASDITRPYFGDEWNARASEEEKRLMGDIVKEEQDHEPCGTVLQEKCLALYKLRALRAPISRVTDDVLRLIFEEGAEVLPSSKSYGYPRAFQIACMGVCRRWHRVSLDTAFLWSRFKITDKSSLPLAIKHVSRRSANAPFELELDFASWNSPPQAGLMDKLTTFISKNAPGLIKLNIRMCDLAIHAFWPCITSQLIALETLYLWPPPQGEDEDWIHPQIDYDAIVLPQVTTLRQLQLRCFCIPRNLSKISTISSLVLDGTSIDQNQLKSLCSYANLQELCLSDISAIDLGAAAKIPVSLNKLRVLKLSYNHCNTLQWCSRLHLPNLGYLEVRSHDGTPFIRDLLEQQASITRVVLSLRSKDAAETVAALSKPAGATPVTSPALVELCVVSGDKAGYQHMDDLLCASLINMVETRIHRGYPLQHLGLYPHPEEEKCAWFRSKLSFRSESNHRTFTP